jgi:DNA primase small subunit
MRLKDATPEERAKALDEVPGLGKSGHQQIERQLPLLTERHMSGGYFDRGDAFQKLIHHAMEQQVIPLAKGETDEPVTSDTKRLIRTPGSLHGKSGLKVVVLSRKELDSFDPLRDAVAFADESHPVNVLKPATVSLKGESIKLEPGPRELPEWAAVFAVMRGWVEPAPRKS